MEGYKIEFRAVPYGSDSHVLEWRYAPDQDLGYTKDVSMFFGLIKYKAKRKHSTKWRQPYIFINHCTSHLYEVDDDFNYIPIFVDSEDDLAMHWKGRFITVEDFINHLNKHEANNIAEYNKRREEYLRSRSTWK